MRLAMPAKFWVSYQNKDGRWKHEIDTACLFNFLNLNGFYALHDDNSSVTQYIRVNGNIVKRTTVKDIKEFVRGWVVDRFEERDILNLVLNTPKLTNAALESLREVSIDLRHIRIGLSFSSFQTKRWRCAKHMKKANHRRNTSPGAMTCIIMYGKKMSSRISSRECLMLLP